MLLMEWSKAKGRPTKIPKAVPIYNITQWQMLDKWKGVPSQPWRGKVGSFSEDDLALPELHTKLAAEAERARGMLCEIDFEGRIQGGSAGPLATALKTGVNHIMRKIAPGLRLGSYWMWGPGAKDPGPVVDQAISDGWPRSMDCVWNEAYWMHDWSLDELLTVKLSQMMALRRFQQPVYAWVWPQYGPGHSKADSMMPLADFRQIVQMCASACDGITLFGSRRETHDPAYWQVVLEETGAEEPTEEVHTVPPTPNLQSVTDAEAVSMIADWMELKSEPGMPFHPPLDPGPMPGSIADLRGIAARIRAAGY